MSANSSPFPYTCELCGEEGFNDDAMRLHTLEHHVNGCRVCPFCDLVEKSSEELLEHVNKSHLDYLTPESDLISYIDDSKPGCYIEDTKQLNNTFSYHTPNGWLSSESDEKEPFQLKSQHSESTIFDGPSDANYKGELSKRYVENDRGLLKDRDYLPYNINVKKDVSGCSNLNGAIINISSDSESGSPLKVGMASAGQGSPLRSQLALKIAKPNKPKKTIPTPSPMTQCLMCEFTSNCPKKLEEHINRAHFDLTSPSVVDNANEVEIGYENPTFNLTQPGFQCPICEENYPNSSLLESHLNTTHTDVLSPVKSDKNNASTSNVTTNTKQPETTCPVCNLRLTNVTEDEAMLHIEEHFDSNNEERARLMQEEDKEARKLKEQEEFEMLRAQYGMEDGEASFASQTTAGMKKAVYNGSMSVAMFYQRSIEMKKASSTGTDDGTSVTPDVVQRIAMLHEGSYTNIVQYALCTAVDHYASAYADKGWGCGYRNMQMVVSCLLRDDTYRQALSTDFCKSGVPSIPTLQKLVERAWNKGFDVQGCEQLGSRLYNTKKWIGACEVVTAFSSLHIRSELIDFHKPTGANGTHPALMDWIMRYFYNSDVDFKPPLYLQHQGHSRTIIGYERQRDGKIVLLILDPSHSPAQVAEALTSHAGLRLFRRGPDALRAKQYQLVVVRGMMESVEEYKDSRILKSIRLPQDR